MDKLDSDQKLGKPLEEILSIAKYILIFVALASAILFIVEFTGNQTVFNYDLSKIGAWGDTIGGVLNPIFGFLALIGLLWTIKFQLDELKLTREEIRATKSELEGSRKANENLVIAANQQNIENSFFQLLSILRDVSDEVKVGNSPSVGQHTQLTGPQSFEQLNNKIHTQMGYVWRQVFYKNLSKFNSPTDAIAEKISKDCESKQEEAEILAKFAYGETYSQYRAELGRYYRVLYNMLRFLSDKRESLNSEIYETYYKLVRANLSDYELTMIFYNCLTDVGKPMRKYVSEFALFDNLPLIELIYHFKGNQDETLDSVNFLQLHHYFGEGSFGRNENTVRNGNWSKPHSSY